MRLDSLRHSFFSVSRPHVVRRLVLILTALAVVLSACQRRVWLNPIDPEGENYIGFDSRDADGDGIGQWEDVEEMAPAAPSDAAIISTVSPTFSLTSFNPEIVTLFWFQVADDPSFAPESLVWDRRDTSTNTLTLPLGYLKNNRQYFWRAKAYDGTAWSDTWSDVRTFAVHIRVADLTELSLSRDLSGGPIILNWQGDPGAVAYHVELSRSQSFAAENLLLTVDDLAEPAFPLNGVLEAGVTYYWRARAEHAGGVLGAWSKISSFTLDSSVLPIDSATPADAAVVATTNPTLVWPTIESAQSYEVQVSGSPDFAPIIRSAEVAGGETSFAIASPLASGHLYFWRVRAQTADNLWGPWSPTWRFSIESSPVQAVSPMPNAIIPPDAGTLAWLDHRAAGGYSVQIARSSDFASPLVDIAVSGTEVDLADYAFEEAVHYWRVGVIDSTGAVGAYSSVRALQIDPAAARPPRVTGPTITKSPSPTWTWTLPRGAVEVRYRFDSEVDWTVPSQMIETTFAPEAELADGAHTLRVQARDSNGNWSAEAAHTIVVDTLPPDVPEIEGADTSADPRPTWTWTTATDADTVNVQLKREDVADWIEVLVDQANYTPQTDLPEGSHTLQVRVRDAAGNWSGPAQHTIIVDRPTPNPPTVVTAEAMPTNDTTPTWSIQTSLNDPFAFRYQLNATDPDGWSEVRNQVSWSYSPPQSLPDGTHVLHVQVADVEDNWSDTTSHAVTIDATAPEPMVVDAPEETWKPRPSWLWALASATDPAEIAEVRYELRSDGVPGTWTFTTALTAGSYTPTTALPQGNSTFSVQARDQAGNWSDPVEFTTVVDSSSIGLEWDHGANWQEDGVRWYHVYSRGDSGWELVQTVAAEPGTPSTTLSGLTIGETYEFMVTADTGTSESGYDGTLTYVPGETYQ